MQLGRIWVITFCDVADTRIDNGRMDLTWESSEEHRLAARQSLLNAKRYRVVVSRQPDSKSARTLTDLELPCLLYLTINWFML